MTNSKVSIATLARTAALAFALANQVSSAAAWWKNNSFTAAAIEGDKRMNSLKNQVH